MIRACTPSAYPRSGFFLRTFRILRRSSLGPPGSRLVISRPSLLHLVEGAPPLHIGAYNKARIRGQDRVLAVGCRLNQGGVLRRLADVPRPFRLWGCLGVGGALLPFRRKGNGEESTSSQPRTSLSTESLRSNDFLSRWKEEGTVESGLSLFNPNDETSFQLSV